MQLVEKVPVVIQVTLSTSFPYNSVAVSRIGPSFAMPSDSHESIKLKPDIALSRNKQTRREERGSGTTGTGVSQKILQIKENATS